MSQGERSRSGCPVRAEVREYLRGQVPFPYRTTIWRTKSGFRPGIAAVRR